MTKAPERQRFRFNLRTLLVGTIVLGAVCGGLGRLYVSNSPSPPRATEVGQSAEFDSQLGELDDRFVFVMAENTRIVLVRIDGTVERVLFDLCAQADLAAGEISGDVRLSPDQRHLLVPCLRGTWEPASNRKLLIVEFSSGKVMEAPIPVGKFEFDMGFGNDSLCHWTDENSLVVSLTYYPPAAAHQFEKKFLFYDLANLDSPRELDLGVTRPAWFQFPDEFTAMYLADDEPVDQWRVRVLAQGQSRLATAKEVADFRRLLLKDGTQDLISITVTQVVQGEELFGTNANVGKSDIRIGGKWVRRSEGLVERRPLWDKNLGLFTWEEYGGSSFQSFYADLHGRYRPWYPGRYVGKIPRSDIATTTDP